MPKDFDPGREYTAEQAQDVTAVLEAEQHRWLAAARAALCYAYQHDFEHYHLTATVFPTVRVCAHGRCDGVLDLVDRAMKEWRYNYPNRTGSGGYLRVQLFGAEPLPEWEAFVEADNAEVAARAAPPPSEPTRPRPSAPPVSSVERRFAVTGAPTPCICGAQIVLDRRWHHWMTGHEYQPAG